MLFLTRTSRRLLARRTGSAVAIAPRARGALGPGSTTRGSSSSPSKKIAVDRATRGAQWASLGRLRRPSRENPPGAGSAGPGLVSCCRRRRHRRRLLSASAALVSTPPVQAISTSPLRFSWKASGPRGACSTSPFCSTMWDASRRLHTYLRLLRDLRLEHRLWREDTPRRRCRFASTSRRIGVSVVPSSECPMARATHRAFCGTTSSGNLLESSR